MARDVTYPMSGSKLDEYDWIANARGNEYEENRVLINRRNELVIFGEVNDAEANYSYDDYALVRLDADYYLLSTSGCSCPDPSETWGIACGPSTLAQIREHLNAATYGPTLRQREEFDAMIACAEAERPQLSSHA